MHAMAEREGFEPPIPVKVCLISSQVHSTGLCHLSALAVASKSRLQRDATRTRPLSGETETPAFASLAVNQPRLQRAACGGRL